MKGSLAITNCRDEQVKKLEQVADDEEGLSDAVILIDRCTKLLGYVAGFLFVMLVIAQVWIHYH